MDLLFLFWSIGTGIICGAGLYKIAIILAVLVTVGILILDMFPIRLSSYLLIINAESKEIEDEIIEEKSQIEKPITKQKKDLITKKDNYKYDLKSKPKLVIIIDDVVSKTQKDKN